jgi:pilus assembly protein CpaB
MKAARIVVLSVALAAGGVAALLAGRSEPPPKPQAVQPQQIASVDVLVAKSDIEMGKSISADDVAWQAWPLNANTGNFIRKSDHPNAVSELAGSVARAPFIAGEPIREAKLVKVKGSGFMAAILPSGMRAVSIGVSPESAAAGFILPNDHVDIVLTKRDREAEKAAGIEVHTSETILADIRVLAIDQQLEEKNGQKVVVGKTATLELTPGQVEVVTLARQTGTLSLALRSITDGNMVEAAPEEPLKRSSSVSVVRFGIATQSTAQK